MKEEWKDIQGYEGLYKISNTGQIMIQERVRLSKGGSSWIQKSMFMKLQIINGYKRITLNKEGNMKVLYIHMLVAEHFLEKKTGDYVIHKNGNRLDNKYTNLMFGEHYETIQKKKEYITLFL